MKWQRGVFNGSMSIGALIHPVLHSPPYGCQSISYVRTVSSKIRYLENLQQPHPKLWMIHNIEPARICRSFPDIFHHIPLSTVESNPYIHGLIPTILLLES